MIELESTTGNGLEDQRALQLALELSMLGLSDSDALSSGFDADARGKKSQNTTECVPVPSSEHVAEIVGRQGKLLMIVCFLLEVYLNVSLLIVSLVIYLCVTNNLPRNSYGWRKAS